jgi:hypothetical protein
LATIVPQPKLVKEEKSRKRGNSKVPTPIAMQLEMPTQALLAELAEKWGRPVDKLPVYIDFPRLATKVVVIVGPMVKPQLPMIDRSKPIPIISPFGTPKKAELSSSPFGTPKKTDSPFGTPTKGEFMSNSPDFVSSVKKMERRDRLVYNSPCFLLIQILGK